MNQRLPAEALAYYLNLGNARSYQAVADHFGVSKRTVTATAARQKWQAQLEAAQAKSREQIGQRFAETLEQANERHVKLGRFLQSQGIAALKNAAEMSSADGIRAIKTGVDIERQGLGEQIDPVQDVEVIIKREYQRWLKPADVESAEDAERASEADAVDESEGESESASDGAAAA